MAASLKKKSLWMITIFIASSLNFLLFVGNENKPSETRGANALVELKRCRHRPLNIFVYSPGFSENCGGCTVLHYLVDRLNVWFEDLNVKAFLIPFGYPSGDDIQLNPAYKTPIIPAWKSVDDGYVIYPEIVDGNPLGARPSKIFRWILYFPGVNGGPPASKYSREENILCYSPGVCTEFNTHLNKVSHLKLVDYGLDMLGDITTTGIRNGTLVHHKKRSWKSGLSSTPDIPGTKLGNHLQKYDRLQLFARYERFVTTDPATFLSVEAAMVGCISIVIPIKGVTKEEWLSTAYSAGDFKYGIAYGEGEITHAVKTLPLVVDNLIEQQQKQKVQIQQFLSMLAIDFLTSDD